MKRLTSFIMICCFIIMPLWAFSLSGCSSVETTSQYALDSSMIALEASTLAKQYENVERLLRRAQKEPDMYTAGEWAVVDKKKMFTDDEWRKLLNVDATIDMLIMRFDAIQKFSLSEVSIEDVKFMSQLAREGYKEGRGVIMNHWDEFQPSTKTMLNAFDKKAVHMNAEIDELIANPSNESINKAVTLISGVLSIAVKMLGTAVL